MFPDSSQLAPRERQVLVLLLLGVTEREIAGQLQLSTGTVHKYVTRIYRHFGATTRAELMAMWIEDSAIEEVANSCLGADSSSEDPTVESSTDRP